MPTFTAINTPAETEIAPKNEPSQSVQIEAQIRECIDGYKSALRLWSKEILNEALKQLETLIESPIISSVQNPETEKECNAYSFQHGGVTMARIRQLIYGSIGKLILESCNVISKHILSQEASISKPLYYRDIDAMDSKINAIKRAFPFLIKAIEFSDGGDPGVYLLVGRCSLLLGKLGAASSAFYHGMVLQAEPNIFIQHQPRNTLLGIASENGGLEDMLQSITPTGWWCLKGLYDIAALRQDTETMSLVVNSVKKYDPSTLSLLSGSDLLQTPSLPLYYSDPPSSIALPMWEIQRKITEVIPATITLTLNDGLISWSSLGDVILQFLWRYITACTESDQIQMMICNAVGCAFDNRDTSFSDLGTGSSIPEMDEEKSLKDIQFHGEPVSLSRKGSLRSDSEVETETEQGESRKRRNNSLSGDEMPAKRRSSRFIERSGSNIYGSTLTNGTSGSSSANARTTSLRNSSRNISLFLTEPMDSSTTEHIHKSVEEWVRYVGILTPSIFTESFSKSKSVAAALVLQLHSRQKGSQNYNTNQSSNTKMTDWCINHNGDDEPVTIDSNYLRSLLNFINPRIKSQENDSLPSDLDSNSKWKSLLSRSDCENLFKNNDGIFDLLLRYMKQLFLEFKGNPNHMHADKALWQVMLKIFMNIHESLLEWILAKLSLCKPSTEDCSGALIFCIVVVSMLTDAIFSMRHGSNGVYKRIIRRWIDSIDRVLALNTELDLDKCVIKYNIARMWSEYELSVINDDITTAAIYITECDQAIFGLYKENNNKAVNLGMFCSFTGAPVTLELVQKCKGHLSAFTNIICAKKLLQTDSTRATIILEDIADTFLSNNDKYIVFSQKIAILRILSSLYYSNSEYAKGIRVDIIELAVYINRILLESDAITMSSLPVSPIICRFTKLLDRIYSYTTSEGLENKSLQSILRDTFIQHSIISLATLAHAISLHLAIDIVSDFSPKSTIPTFITLAFWLFSVLVSATSHKSAIDASSFICSNESCTVPMSELGVSCSQIETNMDNDNCSSTSDASIEESSNPCFVVVNAIHDLLGERGLCTAANGSFLKHFLFICHSEINKDRDNLVYWDAAASCLWCLFEVKLHNSSITTHCSEHLSMDCESANLVYSMIEPELLETIRNRKVIGLRSDLKVIVDKTSNTLGEIDLDQYPHLKMNVSLIDCYLDGINMPSFSEIKASLSQYPQHKLTVPLSLKEIGDRAKVPPAFRTLLFARATIQHDLLRSRMRMGTARDIDDYDQVINDYKLNVALNPTSPEAWHHLGKALSDRADEELVGTASEILDSKYDIAIWQRSALTCALQAIQYLMPISYPVSVAGINEVKKAKHSRGYGNDDDNNSDISCNDEQDDIRKLHINVYSFTGSLLYRIASRPFAMAALEVIPSQVLVTSKDNEENEDGSDPYNNNEFTTWDVGFWSGDQSDILSSRLAKLFGRRFAAPSTHAVYLLAKVMFTRAEKLDCSSWKWPYMLGKSIDKLGDSLAACVYYLKSIIISVASNRRTSCSDPLNADNLHIPYATICEHAMDPTYKLLSTLLKLFYKGSISNRTVAHFLESIPCTPQIFTENEAENAIEDDMFSFSPRSVNLQAKSPQDIHTFKILYMAILQMCNADKRRWHHRPCYLQAWIENYIIGNPSRAKQTLLILLQMRNTSKQLASFYKTEFEAPGKHYLYLEKYLTLYIETMVETSDIDGILLLQKKLKRSSDTLYDSTSLDTKVKNALIKVLQQMVADLSCPKLVVDLTGNEKIMFQGALINENISKVSSITRSCRLNRTHFNFARENAKDNISHFFSLREHLRGNLKAQGTDQHQDEIYTKLGEVQKTTIQYLDGADRALTLLSYIIDQCKGLSDDRNAVNRLYDLMADVYMWIVYMYGQDKRIVHITPYKEGDIEGLYNMCAHEASLLDKPLPRKSTFWQDIIFDETKDESSQQYKLLDPLLEFCVNKLLDAVRESQTLKKDPFVYPGNREVIVQTQQQ